MATVLVVDDLAANREIVTTLLGYRGHEVLETDNGIDALTIARTHHPDIVVSDVLMPGIDGLELVHRLRSDADPATARAPVIFYTANYVEPETRPIADAYGVSRVVLRRSGPQELLDAVDEVLAAGPVDVSLGPSDDFARAHARAVNTKLVEKVRALQHSERKFEAMTTVSPVGIALLDADGNATYVNPRMSDITAEPADRLAGHGWLHCLEPGVRREALDAVRGPASNAAIEHRYRTHLARAGRSDRWLRVHLRPFRDAESDLAGAVVMVDDITDLVAAEEHAAHETHQRQQEARRRDADRLDSMRQMAGGIAHDFNNLLGAILGFLQLASESIAEERHAGNLPTPTAAALLDDLDQAAKAGKRATKLTEQLLAFGRREINEPVTVDLNAYLTAFARGIAEDGVTVDLRLADSVPLVSIDRRGLDRLLRILVRNACEAMPTGGTVTISTYAVDGDAMIDVADTGTGMSPEVIRRAFEPFFSTKQGHRTAGLGLSTAHGIMSQADGEITLSSPPGTGAVVGIRLPSAAGTPAGRARPVAITGKTAPAAAGEKTVLLVDDDEAMRQVTERFITRAGYQVLTAGDGPEALALAETHAGPIHCLVTDVVMLGMDGRQLAHRLLDLRPETKVVFISGFAEALIDDQGQSLEPGRTIIAKPFTYAQLQGALTAALTAANPRPA